MKFLAGIRLALTIVVALECIVTVVALWQIDFLAENYPVQALIGLLIFWCCFLMLHETDKMLDKNETNHI